jgi:cell division protein FtsZ
MKSSVENKILMNCKQDGKRFLNDETRKDFKCRLSGFGIVFFVSGMGGKTGRDLLPELIGYCRELKIRVSCFVSSPFTFEGDVKSNIAIESIKNIRQCADSIVVINNDIIQETGSDFNLGNAFHKSHLLLAENCEVLYNIICKPKYIAIDTNDIYRILRNSKVTIIASGYSNGENRILTAFEDALNSPLFKPYKSADMDNIICTFYCSQRHQIVMEEIEYIHEIMRTRIKEGSDFIWLADFNEELNEDVNVTLIASIKND